MLSSLCPFLSPKPSSINLNSFGEGAENGLEEGHLRMHNSMLPISIASSGLPRADALHVLFGTVTIRIVIRRYGFGYVSDMYRSPF